MNLKYKLWNKEYLFYFASVFEAFGKIVTCDLAQDPTKPGKHKWVISYFAVCISDKHDLSNKILQEFPLPGSPLNNKTVQAFVNFILWLQ